MARGPYKAVSGIEGSTEENKRISRTLLVLRNSSTMIVRPISESIYNSTAA